MDRAIRIITWNCRRASASSVLWDYLLEIDPDVALLQDYGAVPERILEVVTHLPTERIFGREQSPRYMTGILVKGAARDAIPLTASVDWLRRELENWTEFFTARAVTLSSGIDLKVLSVYSPAFPVDRDRLVNVDTEGIQLTQNRDLWGTELLWAALREMAIVPEEPFIVAGDLNSSETFDYLWRGGPRGNREIIERMNALGLYECLRLFRGELTPTFRTPRGGALVHQLDHLYVTPMLLSRLVRCEVGDAERIFGQSPMLSDHLPIIADFVWPT